MTVKDKAMRWWSRQMKRGECVVSIDKIPDQRQREFLLKEKFIFKAYRGCWILKRPEDSIEEILPILFWQIVSKVISPLGHWGVRGRSALEIYNGAQAAQGNLIVRTRKKTNRKISLPLGFDLSLVYDPDFDERLIRKIEIAGVTIPVDIPEKVLIDLRSLGSDPDVLSFIAGTHFDLKIIEALYAKSPRPIVFRRLIRLAKEVERFDLVVGLERIIETYTYYRVARRENIEEKFITKKPALITSPWVIRQKQQIKEFEKVLEKLLKSKMAGLRRGSINRLLVQAREHKKYDTYHSTTLEGYRITPEEVDALLSGIAPEDKQVQDEKYFEALKNRMAILGYSEAFDFIINKTHEDFNQPEMTEDLVKDIYYRLFKPSANAGLIDYITLVSYRNVPAFIRGTPYVPPSHLKLPELMADYVSSISQIKNPVVRAILAHYFFVTIHPYVDGNGRTARFLMNYLLMASGYPWITIRADQRVEYFDALKKGQVNGDILPFGKFILKLVQAH